MALYFRVADHREVSAAEALDSRGVLKSGYGQRVPAHLADHAPRFTDGRSFWDHNKDSLLVVDARRIGGTEGNRPGYRVFDSDVGRAVREAAYAEAEAFLRDSWRQPVRDAFGSYPYTAAAEGAQCTINGAPGVLVKEGRVLVCRPLAADAAKPPRDPEENEDEDDEDDEDDDGSPQGERVRPVTADAMSADRRTVDQIAHDHFAAMERLYAARNREISEAWREGKAANG